MNGTGAVSINQTEQLEAFDIQRILECLPHRYPFLLVDRIHSIDKDRSCVGIKNVTINEPHFQGHFPGRPVMPGVLIIEGMAQTAGAICLHAAGVTSAPSVVFFMTIDKAKFRKPVVPGDRLEYHMTRQSQRRTMFWFSGRAMVDGQLVCEAEISAMLAPAR